MFGVVTGLQVNQVLALFVGGCEQLLRFGEPSSDGLEFGLGGFEVRHELFNAFVAV